MNSQAWRLYYLGTADHAIRVACNNEFSHLFCTERGDQGHNIRIVLDDRIWKLRTNILEPTTNFFSQSIKDAASVYHLYLEDMDPDLLHWLLNFLYNSETPEELKKLLEDPTTIFQTCYKIIDIAGRIGIDDMQWIMVLPLAKLFTKQASKLIAKHEAIVKKREMNPDDKLLDDSFVEGFFTLAKLFYTQDWLEGLRQIMMEWLERTNWYALYYKQFRDEVYKVPGMAKGVDDWPQGKAKAKGED
ncbi:hypothetical protein F4804DRAFT_329320 [Jackrogersella minutella]|nr:hypothetical protein F4804DRAFT_329320 [Jackrogersella minutella]